MFFSVGFRLAQAVEAQKKISKLYRACLDIFLVSFPPRWDSVLLTSHRKILFCLSSHLDRPHAFASFPSKHRRRNHHSPHNVCRSWSRLRPRGPAWRDSHSRLHGVSCFCKLFCPLLPLQWRFRSCVVDFLRPSMRARAIHLCTFDPIPTHPLDSLIQCFRIANLKLTVPHYHGCHRSHRGARGG